MKKSETEEGRNSPCITCDLSVVKNIKKNNRKGDKRWKKRNIRVMKEKKKGTKEAGSNDSNELKNQKRKNEL